MVGWLVNKFCLVLISVVIKFFIGVGFVMLFFVLLMGIWVLGLKLGILFVMLKVLVLVVVFRVKLMLVWFKFVVLVIFIKFFLF